MKIIPAINAVGLDEAQRRIGLLRSLTSEFHLDISAPPVSDYSCGLKHNELDKLSEDLKLDLHLMLALQPTEILKWADRRIKKLILHLEVAPNPNGLITMARKTNKEIFLAWSPGVELEILAPYLKFIDGLLVLNVQPGRAGQPAVADWRQRVSTAKEKLSTKQKLLVDGGLRADDIPVLKGLGVDLAVMASGIYNELDPSEVFQKLQKLAV